MSGIFQHFKDGKSNDFEFNVVRETELVFGEGLTVHMDDWHVFVMFRNLIRKANSKSELERLHAIADRVSKEPDLQIFLNKLTLIHPGAQQNVEGIERAEAFWKEHPTWWEQNVEAQFQAMSDSLRKQASGDLELTVFDVSVGVGKGVYHFGKDAVEGILGIAIYAKDFFTNEKTREDAWELTKRFSWWFFRINSGIPSWREEAARETGTLVQSILNAISASIQEQWKKSVAEGKEDELIAQWTTQGILEVATIVLGAVKAAKVAKLQKTLGAVKTAQKGARKLRPPSVKRLLKKNINELEASVAKQQKLYKAALATSRRMKEEMDGLVHGIKGAKVDSITKGHDEKSFVKGVIEKNKRETKKKKPYPYMGKMTDMSRGRVNVQRLEDIEEVVFRLQKKAGTRIVDDAKMFTPPYPRRHIVVLDEATGMAHEWQIGTHAATEFFENTKITKPKGLDISGNPDFHDIVYDRLEPFAKAVKDGTINVPGMKKYLDDLGVYKFLEDYEPVMWKTRDGSFPGFEEKRWELRDRLQVIIDRIHTEKPGTIETMSHK